MKVTMLLGAEQFAEDVVPENADWIREATKDEAELFQADHPQLSAEDKEGRPYWHVVVETDKAPSIIAKNAVRFLKVFRWHFAIALAALFLSGCSNLSNQRMPMTYGPTEYGRPAYWNHGDCNYNRTHR